jgi:predicted acyl esterase
MDQKVTEPRPDELIYSADVLNDDTEITGIVEANLVFSADVTDTNFFARW